MEWPIPLLLGFAAFILLYGVLSVLKFRAFNMGLDFGNMLQSFYATLDGRILEMTRTDTGENIGRLFGHVELVYLLLIPFFAALPRPETLLCLQSLALGAGGLAVFWIARRLGLERRPALALAGSYWCFPYLANLALADFHSDAFMVFPHLMAWYCLRRGWRRGFWVYILLGALCKEYAALFNGLLGVLLFRERRRDACMLMALALAQYFVFTPLINLWATRGALRLQLEDHVVPGSIGGAWAKFAEKAFTRECALNGISLIILFNLSLYSYRRGAVLWLPLWLGLALVNPWGLFANHRHAMLIAPLFITLCEGAARMPAAWRRSYPYWGALAPAVALALFYPGALLAQNLAEMTYKPRYRNLFHYRYTPHDAVADSLLSKIPPGVPVASDYALRTKLANRPRAYVHPFPLDSTAADFYLFDFFEGLGFGSEAERRLRCAGLMASGNFQVQSYVDGILVLARHPGASSGFSLRRLAGKDSAAPAGFRLDEAGFAPVPGGYRMRTLFTVGEGNAGAHALLSFFASPTDTLRVLHLPVSMAGGPEALAPGTYAEEFFFQIPAGKTLEARTHGLALFRKDPFLTLFSRPEFLLRRL